MKKKFFYIVTIFLLALFSLLFYLSIFGINTNKFNKNITDKIKENFPKANLELDKINLLINPLKLTIELKTKNANIMLDNTKVLIKEISTEYSIFSFLNKEFGINNIYFETKKNKIKDVIKLIRINKDSPQLFILQKLIKDGSIKLDAKISFEKDGKIKKNYEISGDIENLSLKLPNNKKINNINSNFTYIDEYLKIEKTNLNYLNLEFFSKEILISKRDNVYNLMGSFNNQKSNVANSILELFFNEKIIKNVAISSENIFDFNIDKKFKISDLNIKSKIFLHDGLLSYKIHALKNIIPDFDGEVKILDHKIDVEYNNKLKIQGTGKFQLNDKIDQISYNSISENGKILCDLNILFAETPLKIDIINYKKNQNIKSNLKVKIKKTKNNFSLEEFSYSSKDASFLGKNFNFNEDYNLDKFNKIELTFKNEYNFNNDLSIIRKKNQYFISSNRFAIDKIVEEAIFGNDDKSLRFFDSKKKFFNFKIKKALIDNEHDLLNLNGKFELNKNEITNFDLTSNFKDNKNILFSIKTSNKNKVTTFYSELAKPFVKKFKFIKGFEEGEIEFISTKNNNVSSSSLKIYDFKLKELPALTKVLTLASLQGISDLLTGEGVRFDEFEMIFTNKNNLMQISEIYSIGPAISILMDGYVQKDELVSLKGTLVPATTINKFVASIPVLGEILVGKKTGEGVFGVSFKIKGPPKDLKTTVNPIKTLTPRFITRTLEKIKKNN